ncbi:MAG: hypothetical protein EBU88_07055 [Acidobacteria bacterium]|nr:hypothetical protein [Acidobacteriota bacterium]
MLGRAFSAGSFPSICLDFLIIESTNQFEYDDQWWFKVSPAELVVPSGLRAAATGEMYRGDSNVEHQTRAETRWNVSQS